MLVHIHIQRILKVRFSLLRGDKMVFIQQKNRKTEKKKGNNGKNKLCFVVFLY